MTPHEIEDQVTEFLFNPEYYQEEVQQLMCQLAECEQATGALMALIQQYIDRNSGIPALDNFLSICQENIKIMVEDGDILPTRQWFLMHSESNGGR